MIKIGTQKNQPKFYPNPVYVGFATVYTNDGKYLYRKYSSITRLTKDDALTDAKQVKQDLIDHG